jgi:hypothetical protein
MIYDDNRMKTSEMKFRSYIKMIEKDAHLALNSTIVDKLDEK